MVRHAAAELPTISLHDALRVCLLIRDRDPEHYERAAIRWVGRFALEASTATLGDVRAAADALAILRDDADDGMARLQRLCLAHGLG
jgi:hypothetical protein